jgi:hypothetical protein
MTARAACIAVSEPRVRQLVSIPHVVGVAAHAAVDCQFSPVSSRVCFGNSRQKVARVPLGEALASEARGLHVLL